MISTAHHGRPLSNFSHLLEKHKILQKAEEKMLKCPVVSFFKRYRENGPPTPVLIIFPQLRSQTHNEEAGSEENRLDLHVQINGELDPKVVRVGEDFLKEAAPLLTDPAHPAGLVPGLHLQEDKKAAFASHVEQLATAKGRLHVASHQTYTMLPSPLVQELDFQVCF